MRCCCRAGIVRDSMDDETPAFVVRDRNYVSARWPGDVHTFAKTFANVLNELTPAESGASHPVTG